MGFLPDIKKYKNVYIVAEDGSISQATIIGHKQISNYEYRIECKKANKISPEYHVFPKTAFFLLEHVSQTLPHIM